MNFEFATAARIIFGAGKSAELPALVRGFGSRVLLVRGASGERTAELVARLCENGIALDSFTFPGEPTIEVVQHGASRARESVTQVVLAIGGGSVIDAGKAIAALATNRRDPLDYLEVVGKGESLECEPLPFIAVPTTAGTGAEVTRNAVLSVPEKQAKVSLRHVSMLPKIALIDPTLTLSLPGPITAMTGLDALTQLIEPFVCARANPLTDAICREGLRLCADALRRVFHEPENLEARTKMSIASLFGGLALANAGLGAVHGFAAPLGGIFAIPHGRICATLLPHVWRANVNAARRLQKPNVVKRYAEAATILFGCGSLDDGAKQLDALVGELGCASLSLPESARAMIPEICERAARASSMKANPVQLSQRELQETLAAAF